MQHTLKTPVRFDGFGLHSGQRVGLVIYPAGPDHGIVFCRTDVETEDPLVPALWNRSVPTKLHTKLANISGVSVATVEHLMAAFAGTGVQNALVEIDGPEVPILDGSALPFVAGILNAGIVSQGALLEGIRVLRPVEATAGGACARLVPADGLEISFEIEFDDAAIGHQAKSLSLNNGNFASQLSDSRTFCRQRDVEAMYRNGLALGGSYFNAVVVDGARILSPGGWRHDDEAVRHKMLDAVGDLALAGAPLFARYEGLRAGHSLTNALLRELFSRCGAYEKVVVDSRRAARMPGAGLVWDQIPQVV